MRVILSCGVLLLLASCAEVPLHTNHSELKNVKAAIADARAANAENCAPAQLASAVTNMYWAAHEIEEGMHQVETPELLASALASAKKSKSLSAINCKPAPVVVTPPKLKVEGVNFHTSSAELTMNSKLILDGVVKKLKAYPKSVNLQVAAHTDSDGSDANNLALSNKRAKQVMAYLVKHGIDPSTLTSKGYGESQPIASNNTAEGKAKNRRVMFNIIK
ncbi:MAG: OmpA family protein [Mariprofundaceae bacterium]|nr:OmpA family protein [Mariprofundaceae bacterium]